MDKPPRLAPGPPAKPENRIDGLNQYRILSGELDRVRARADNWRKGVAGLLAGILGFSLIGGRSEIDKLDTSFAIATGVALGGAVLAGAVATAYILRAAHGQIGPLQILTGRRSDGRIGRAVTEHEEAQSTYRALRTGLGFAVAATIGLLVAVAMTWYGPAKEPSSVVVTERSGATWCGRIEQTAQGMLTLKTPSGPVVVDLRSAVTIKVVDDCPEAS